MFCIFSISRSARLRRALLSKYELATSIAIAGGKPYIFFFPSRRCYNPRSEAEWGSTAHEYTLLRPFSFFSTRTLSSFPSIPNASASVLDAGKFMRCCKAFVSPARSNLRSSSVIRMRIFSSKAASARRRGLGWACAPRRSKSRCRLLRSTPTQSALVGSPSTIVNYSRAPA